MNIKLMIDIGNSNIVFGIADIERNKILFKWRSICNVNITSDDFAINLINHLNYFGIKINSVSISCVVAEMFFVVKNAILNYFDIIPKIVDYKLKCDLNFDELENPEELGADRIVDCLAGYKFYGEKKFDLIIIDFGTATTYDLIDKSGKFITGITAPGMKIAAKSLFNRASLLSGIEIYDPKKILVKNTGDSLRAGIIYSQVGACEFIINKLKNYYPKAKVIATGGLCSLINSNLINIKDLDLTLKGLMLV